MTTKRLNPYQRLLNQIKDFLRDDVKYRHKKLMWRYSKKSLNNGWDLSQVYERVQAAEQLGYDVQLIANGSGLEVHYIKKINIPYGWE